MQCDMDEVAVEILARLSPSNRAAIKNEDPIRFSLLGSERLAAQPRKSDARSNARNHGRAKIATDGGSMIDWFSSSCKPARRRWWKNYTVVAASCSSAGFESVIYTFLVYLCVYRRACVHTLCTCAGFSASNSAGLLGAHFYSRATPL